VTFDEDTDAEVFRTYGRRILYPVCPALRAGAGEIIDNLSPHKSERTLSLMAQVGAEIRILPASEL